MYDADSQQPGWYRAFTLLRVLMILLLLGSALPGHAATTISVPSSASPTFADFNFTNVSGATIEPDTSGVYMYDPADQHNEIIFTITPKNSATSFDLTGMSWPWYTGGSGYVAVKITGTKWDGTVLAPQTYSVNSTTPFPASLAGLTSLKSFTFSLSTNTGSTGNVSWTDFTVDNVQTPAGAPTVSTVSPSIGATAGGTSVTITGTNFVPNATSVTIGGTAATISSTTATSITVTTPGGTGAKTLTVTTLAGSANGTYTYADVPVVSSLSPIYGPLTSGTAVSIVGGNFTGATVVSFGGTAASFTVVDGAHINATAPAHAAGTVHVTVTNTAGDSAATAADQYTFLAAPTVATVSPATGSSLGGTSITITGTNFVNGQTSITIGGVAATGITVVNASTLTATTPAGTPGAAADVVVTTPGGSATKSGGFTYNPLPAVTSISPSAGPTAGGTPVIISGTHLTGATGVSFGATAAASYTVDSDMQITAVSPAGAAGTVHVTVTSGDGTNVTSSADQFTYVSRPTVTAVSPNAGPTAGGTVTIAGTNFTGATAVSFGGTAATTYSIDSATQITATAPAHTAGTVDVTVTTVGGTSATGAADQYTYVATPTVTGITPNGGPIAGGTPVAIAGTGFTGATGVSFGGTAATSYTVNSATSITATSPAGTGTAHVTVTTPGGTSATSSADQFTWYSAPTFTGVSPNAGPTGGGGSVTITGTHFTGVTGVTFGGNAATGITVVNDSTLTATTPAHAAGAVDVIVTNPGGSATGSNAYTYHAAPTITGVSPAGGPVAGGTSINIGGTNFVNGSTTVTIGGAVATVSAVNLTSISATTPSGTAGAQNVVVTTPGGTVTSAGGFTYYAVPTVSGISPSAGPLGGGASVTITGNNFTGATGVTIGGSAATGITVVNNNTITATTPVGTAGAKDVVVTTPGGSGTLNSGYTYVRAPVITDVSPNSGPQGGGTTVVIHGVYFTGATAVTVGGTAAAGYTVDSDTQITLTTPAGTPGARDVVVTTAGGASTGGAGLFAYIAAPTVTSLSATSGPLSGGTVTVTGTNFTGATAVYFGTTAATSFSVVGATEISATIPAHTAGTVHVTVVTPGGTSATSASDQYTYVAPPTVTGVTTGYGAAVGPAAGGTSVSITGTNFTTATAVYFGATAASYTVNSATSITASSPAHATGTVDITVVTVGGTSALSSSDRFRYMAAATVTQISPNMGPEAGGTSITITGTNFTAATGVTVGGAAATSVTVVSDTSITAVTPAGTAGARDVVVAGVGGNGTAPGLFAYLAVPTVSTVSPNVGPLGGGTTVTIAGTNFTGATAVTIGGTAAASFTVDSATQITAVTAAGTAGAKDVVITNTVGSGTGSGLFTYVAAPTVTGASVSGWSIAGGPTAGGTTVTITGTNFTTATAVTIGGTPATSFTVNSATQITATSPAGTAGAKNIVVTAVGGSGTGNNLFTYFAAPTVSGITPTSGPSGGGTAVTISGTNFVSGATNVTIGGAAATTSSVGASSIGATTPAGTAGARDVIVTTPGGSATLTGGFTYIPAPAVTSVSPNAGPVAGGTHVTITGTNLSGATSVRFGTTTATVTSNTATQIVANAPAHAVGTVDVTVTTSGGTSATGAADQFTYVAAPTVTGATPASGGTAGGTSVTVTGTSFVSVTAVTVGGNAAAFTVNSATQLTLTTPAGTAGAKDIVVTTSYGTGTGAHLFTYIAGPTVTAINPNAGDVGGGTSVVITGTGFTGATAVSIGGAVASFTVNSATRITAVTAAHAAGAVDVAVTTPYGTGTGSGLFTYAAIPTSANQTATYMLNTPVVINLAAVIGSGTSINVVAGPRHGQAVVSGTQVTYTPANGFWGNDSFTYVSVNAGLISPRATVTLNYGGTRPDPSQDADVKGVLEAQRQAAKRFSQAQLMNFQHRLESLHRPAPTAPTGDNGTSGADEGDGARLPSGVGGNGRARAGLAGTDGRALTNGGASGGSAGGMPLMLASSLTSLMTTSTVTLGAATDEGAAPVSGPWNYWGVGSLRFGTRDAKGNQQGTDFRTDGITLGADRRYGDNLVLGMGVGYGHDKATIGTEGSENNSDAYTVAVYGSWQAAPQTYLDALVGYGALELQSSRYITSFGQTATANRGGSLVFGSVTGAYEYRLEEFMLSPYGRYDISVANLASVTESGAGAASLRYDSQSFTSQAVSLGLRGETTVEVDWGKVRPTGRVELQHHMDGGDQATLSYADLTTTRYSITVPKSDSNSVLLGLGGSMMLDSGLNFGGELQYASSSDRERSWGILLRLSAPLKGD